MITMLYEKTLHRKILGAKQTPKSTQTNGETNGETNGHTDGDGTSKHQPGWLRTTFQLVWSRIRSLFSKKKAEEEKEYEPASMGKILNLMRNDVYEVAQRFWDISDIVTKPLGVIFATLLIWRMLGWSCLLGVLALAVTQTVNVSIARWEVYFEKKRRVATDEKLQRINQFISSIRHLRWYGWQGMYHDYDFELLSAQDDC
jgi:hypothetical protein